MDLFLAICQALGLGVAVGMLAGAAGRGESVGLSLVALAAIAGAVAGGLSAAVLDDESLLLGAVAGLAAGAATAYVVGGVTAGAVRRGGGGATGFIITLAALVVAAASILVPLLAFAAIALIAYLGFVRRRRAQRKHAGLRVLR
jgi:hypothetical protein